MRFGIAVTDVTPPFKTPMRGYSVRKDHFDAVHDPLTFTAVVLEEGERRALIGVADICAFPNDGSVPELLARLGEIVGCPPDNVMLNASHTHGGPSLPSSRSSTHLSASDAEACERYEALLYERVAEAATDAAGHLRDGSLWFGEGRTALPISRRLERDGQILHAPAPGAPTDDRMHVLAFRDADEKLAAVGMKLSCHPVATAYQHLLTADYPGAWREEFSRAFGQDVTPFFLQGAGADARPRHTADGDQWRALPHAELADIGREVLAECLTVLTGRGLEPVDDLLLTGRISPADVPCEKTFTRREQFGELLQSADSRKQRYAERCLELLGAGEQVPDHQTFHVQTLWLNSGLALIGLDVEPLCGLGRSVEAAVSPRRAMLLGYTNGSVAYAPGRDELPRGGYEAESFYGKPWTGPLCAGIEDHFAEAVMLI